MEQKLASSTQQDAVKLKICKKIFPCIIPFDLQYSYKMIDSFISRVFQGIRVISYDEKKINQINAQFNETGQLPQVKSIQKLVKLEFQSPTLTRLFILYLRKKLKSVARVRIFNVLLRRNIQNALQSKEESSLIEQFILMILTKYIMENTFTADNLSQTLKISAPLRYQLSKVLFLSKISLPCAFIVKCLSKQIIAELIPKCQIIDSAVRFIHPDKSLQCYENSPFTRGSKQLETSIREKVKKSKKEREVSDEQELMSLASNESEGQDEEKELQKAWKAALERQEEYSDILQIN